MCLFLVRFLEHHRFCCQNHKTHNHQCWRGASQETHVRKQNYVTNIPSNDSLILIIPYFNHSVSIFTKSHKILHNVVLTYSLTLKKSLPIYGKTLYCHWFPLKQHTLNITRNKTADWDQSWCQADDTFMYLSRQFHFIRLYLTVIYDIVYYIRSFHSV